jgi:hypothetical protein
LIVKIIGDFQMAKLSELPYPTRIEIPKFDNAKRYADGQGFWMDRPATRPGYYSMINGYAPLRPDLPVPPDFRFEIVPV